MEDKTYPKIINSIEGFSVQTSAGANLPGFYTSLRRAEQAIRTYEIQKDVAKQKRQAKKKD